MQFTLGKPVTQPSDGGKDRRGQRFFRGSRSSRNNDAGNVTGVGPGATRATLKGQAQHPDRAGQQLPG